MKVAAKSARETGLKQEVGIAFDGARVRVSDDGNGNPILIIQAEYLPYFEGPHLTPEFQDYLASTGISQDIIMDKLLDAVEAENRVSVLRSVLI